MAKPRSRKEMILFLSNHQRYDTMSSWNRGTSFSRNIKLHRIQFPDTETRNRAWELLDVEEAFAEFDDTIAEFNARHGYSYQIHRNGRSGGYLVLYHGGRKDTGYQSYCPACGQRNYQKAEEGKNLCGVCKHPRRNYTHPVMTMYTTGETIGEPYGEYDDWDTCSLKSLVDVVWDFDKTVEAAIQTFIDFALHNEAAEETIMVPKKVKVSRPVEGAA
jgi:hypothetical protein